MTGGAALVLPRFHHTPYKFLVQMAVATSEELHHFLPSLEPLWHHKAPRPLVECWSAQDVDGAWKIWQKHLQSRKKPAIPPFLTKKKSPLLWGWPGEWDRRALNEAISSPAMLAEIVIGDDRTAAPDLPRSMQMVALAYALPTLARELPADTWWLLLERLYEVVAEVNTHRIDWPCEPNNVLRQQLLAGELPLALGCVFPEIRAMRALRAGARAVLSETLIELTDGQGLPDARLLGVLGPLFACWTRARWLGEQLKRGPWSRPAELQFQWLVRHAIRLADSNGRFLLSTGENAWHTKLFEAAIELAGDRGDRAAARIALPRVAIPKSARFAARDLPDPSLNSDWAGITIMADGWSQSDARLAVAFVHEPMTIELSIAGEALLRGEWTSETSCDGQPVHATGKWEQLCWESGKRFDLLELGLELSEGLRLERQILFVREDSLLYLADNIISHGDAARTIRHSFGLPLAGNVAWRPEAETRDGLLVGRNARTAVLPLALSEWRCDPRGGSLELNVTRLVLTQETNARALCCPLLIDLKRKRTNKPRTWRQLTVGENLEAVPRDVAVGFRAQSGRDQWLFYRSLGPAGNRTILGQNIAGEFSAGRFLASGQLKEWIEIEAV